MEPAGTPLPLTRPTAGVALALRGLLARAIQIAAGNWEGFGALADQAVVSLTNFLTSVIVGRSCSKEEFGLYALAFVVTAGVTEIQISLISSPYTVYRPRLGAEESRTYTGATIVFQLAFSLLALIVLVAGGAVLSVGYHAALGRMLMVLGLTSTTVQAKEHLRRVSFATMDMRKAAVLDGSVFVLQVGALLWLAHMGVLSAVTALVAIGVVCGVATLGWLVLQRHEYRIAWEPTVSNLRSMWALGRWISASGVLAIVSSQIYAWLLVTIRGTVATALWAAGSSITSVVNPARMALTNYLAPAAARAYAIGGPRKLRRLVLEMSAVWLAGAFPFCLLVLVFGARALSVVYGRGYANHGLLVSLFALNLIPVGLSVITSRGLFALERADVDFKINIAPFAIAVLAGIWLVRWHGAEGAAAAGLLGSSLAAAARCSKFLTLCRAAIKQAA